MSKRFLSAFFLLSILVAAAAAQSAIEQSVRSARDTFTDIKNRSVEMERVKRDANTHPTVNTSTVAFPKIKEDFEQIQKLNSEAIQPTLTKLPVDHNAFLKAVAELNRRAVRLKSNLFLAEPENQKSEAPKNPTASATQEITLWLADLDKSVNNFAHSSIFQNISVVNPEDSLKAQGDLDKIIKISHLIREKAKKTGGDFGK